MLEAKFAISTKKGQTKFCNMKENIFIHWYFSDEGGRKRERESWKMEYKHLQVLRNPL